MTIKLSSEKETPEVEQQADIAKKIIPEREPNWRAELEPDNRTNANAKAAMARELEGMGLSPEAIERILCMAVASRGKRHTA